MEQAGLFNRTSCNDVASSVQSSYILGEPLLHDRKMYVGRRKSWRKRLWKSLRVEIQAGSSAVSEHV